MLELADKNIKSIIKTVFHIFKKVDIKLKMLIRHMEDIKQA